MQQNYRIRPHRPVLALILLFLTVMAFSLLLVAREANNSEAKRVKDAVTTAVNAEINSIVKTATEKAKLIDPAIVSAPNNAARAQLFALWGTTSAASKDLDTIAVIDKSNSQLLHMRDGRLTSATIHSRLGNPLSTLIQKTRNEIIATGGIVSTSDGVMVVASAPIRMPLAQLDRQATLNGSLTLVVTRPIDMTSLTQLAPELRIQMPDRSPKFDQSSHIDLDDPSGVKIATITWRKPTIGYQSLLKASPLIGFVALIHIFFALLLVSRAYSSVKQLEAEALIDSLSKLPNRRALRAKLERKLRTREKSALAFIDLDGFKIINDNYGHVVGDRLIVAVAEMLADLCGKSTMVARLGGDEFAILASGLHCVADLEAIAQKILARMAHPFKVDERTVIVGASIGLAVANINDFNTIELMRRSDVAMYVAKRTGKMRMCWYDEMLDQRQETARTIESELRDAIETEMFDMVYQPVMNSSGMALVGVEALLRWASPTRGDIGPSEFIPVAEETGLIDRIGMIALRKVCVDALAWDGIDVSINVSVAQMRNPEFAKNLSLVLNEAGFPANRLILDINEDCIAYDPEMSRKTIAEINDIGVRVAVDNYGTGSMSLPYLKKFNINKIKIDGSLSADACKNEQGLIILNTVSTLAKALGFQVSAEGIETEHQAEFVKVIGCEQLQGWLFSREVPAGEISNLINQSKPLSRTVARRVRNG